MRVRLAIGIVVAALGGALVALPGVPAPPQLRLGQAPAPVNSSADDPLDISANNSPTLARNPTDAANVVLAHRIDLPRFGCGLHVSFDGGATWEQTDVPQPPDTEPKCYAPDVAFAPDGTLYVSWVMLAGRGNTPDSVWFAASTDGGRSLSEPVHVTGPLAFQVRLTADPTRAGRVYLSWLQAQETGIFALPETGNPIVVARSDDGGRTWGEPQQASAPARERVLAATPGVADDGTVLLAYLDVLEDRLDYHGGHEGLGGPAYPGPWELVVARSSDGGRTWSEVTVDGGLVPIERFLVFLPPFPALAVHGDRVHVAFHDARRGDPDVWLWSSTDGGRSFREPVRVNDTADGDGTSQYLPQLDMAAGGRLDVVYYDRRADRDDVLNEVSVQSSADGGNHFSERENLSDRPFDSRVGFGSERDLPDLGSRLALQSSDDHALAAWADTRPGSLEWGEQDVYRATVAVDEPPSGMGPRRGAGVALLVVGVAVVGLAVRSARAGRRAASGRDRAPARRREPARGARR